MSQLYRRFLLGALGAAAVACSHPAPAAQPTLPVNEAKPAPEAKPPAADPYAAIDAAGAGAITADFLRAQITKLASDDFEGRGPTTKGDIAARAYLVEQLKALGYEPGSGEAPGAPGAWEQPFELVGMKAAMPATWSFAAGKKKIAMKWWDQYIAGSGVQTAGGAIKNAE